MGNLHEGHISLTHLAHEHADIVCTTIFVNPTQFGPNEDLDAYPRTFDDDLEKLTAAGVELVFAPKTSEMYQENASTAVTVSGLTDCLCGHSRPDHFQGVATIVTKLLLQALPEVAVFGEKDFQQLQVIRRLVRDLDIPVEIIGGAISREGSGLALSSRNRYLSAEQKEQAAELNRVLKDMAAAIRQGADISQKLAEGKDRLVKAGFASVDYLEARHEDDLTVCETFQAERPTRLFGAAFMGQARLIDNLPI